MSTTSNRAYPYPQLTDDFDPPGDFQALAVAVDADVEAVVNPPSCFVVQQAVGIQTGWTTSTPTAVTFAAGSTVLDSDAIHSESSNTSRLVIGKKLGWWKVSGVYCPVGSNAAATAFRAIVYRNGVAVPGSFGGLVGTQIFVGVQTPVVDIQATASGDYVELMGYMTAASGTIGTSVSSPYVACSLRAEWIRES